jgi:integrase
LTELSLFRRRLLGLVTAKTGTLGSKGQLIGGGAHDLRHAFINVAHDQGVNEIFVRLLVGHALTGVHASYLTRLVGCRPELF